MPGEKPSAEAEACWDSFVEYPTYIRRERAIAAIATAIDAAREQGRREREAEIVGWLQTDDRTANYYADLIERGAGRKETT
jgi:hypothetical protein